MKKVLQLTGLDCAHCAAQLEREISKLEGVHFASLVFVSQKLTVEYENEEALDRVIRHANAFEEVRVIEKDNEESKPTHKKELISLAFSALALIVCGVLFHFAFYEDSQIRGFRGFIRICGVSSFDFYGKKS